MDEQCGRCFQDLDPAALDENQFPQCARCLATYHPQCWDREQCVTPGCGGKTCYARSVPLPLGPAQVVVNYPIPGGRVNVLTDEPLGLSCGTVMDGHEGAVWVRNNSAYPLAVPPCVWVPWVTVRVVPEPCDLPTPEGWQVIPPQQRRELSVRFHAARPPHAAVEVPLAAIILPVGPGADRPTVAWLGLISRPTDRRGIVFGGGGLLALLVLQLVCLLRAAWNPDASTWWVSALFGAACAWFTALAPGPALVPALVVAGAAAPLASLAGRRVALYRAVGWLVGPEPVEWWSWVGRRAGTTALVLAGTTTLGWLVWAPLLWVLRGAAEYTFLGVLLSLAVAAGAVYGWEQLARLYHLRLVGPIWARVRSAAAYVRGLFR